MLLENIQKENIIVPKRIALAWTSACRIRKHNTKYIKISDDSSIILFLDANPNGAKDKWKNSLAKIDHKEWKKWDNL